MNKAASELGKLSAKARHKGKTKKEISAYYSSLRKGKKLDKKLSTASSKKSLANER